MVLALRTGIAPAAWLAEGDQAIATAWDLLDEQDQARQPERPDGVQMSG